jgi:hypothetical protein
MHHYFMSNILDDLFRYLKKRMKSSRRTKKVQVAIGGPVVTLIQILSFALMTTNIDNNCVTTISSHSHLYSRLRLE